MNTLTFDKRKYVLVPVEEYRRLTNLAKAAEGDLVPLPPADEQGNRPALACVEASIARNIVKRRQAVGMNQKELAKAAGIRPEVLNRAERGVTVPSVRTLAKIEAALKRAGQGREPAR